MSPLLCFSVHAKTIKTASIRWICRSVLATLFFGLTAVNVQSFNELPALQARPNSCGLAAVAFIAESFGIQGITEQGLAKLLAPSYAASQGAPPQAGYSLGDIARLGKHLSLQTVVMRSDIAGLRSAHLPTMLLLDAASSPHFVVVTELKERVATLFDPAQGWHSVDLVSLQSHWLDANSTGVYVQFMR